MKTTATVTGPDGKVKLTFGVYGLKNFCKRLGCEPDIRSVLAAFRGGTRLEALSEIIRSGIEQTAADKGEAISITDYEACQVLETATEAEGEKTTAAFFSSILNEDYDVWLDRLIKQVEAKQAEVEEAESDDEKKSPSAGTTSNPKLTEKSA
ncbi:hypothetical protein [Spirosoma fluminis]